MALESIYAIVIAITIAIAAHRHWLKNVAPVFQTIRRKIKTNCEFPTLVFLRIVQVAPT